MIGKYDPEDAEEEILNAEKDGGENAKVETHRFENEQNEGAIQRS